MYRECREYGTTDEFCHEWWMVQSGWSGASIQIQIRVRTSGERHTIHPEYYLSPPPAPRDLPADSSVYSCSADTSLRHPTNTTPVTSGSEVEPVVIPLKVPTNPNNPFPSRQAMEGGLVHYGVLPLSQPSYRGHYVSGSTGTYPYGP